MAGTYKEKTMSHLVKVTTMLMVETWVDVSGEASDELAAQKAEAHATDEVSTKYPVIETPQSDAVMVKQFPDEEGAPVTPGARTVPAPESAPVPKPPKAEPPPKETEVTTAGAIPDGAILADKNLFALLMQLRAAVEYALENDDDSRTMEVMEQLGKLQVSVPPPAELISLVV